MRKIAYSYIRFSSAQQKLGDSKRRQLAAAEAYCAENGYTLDTSISLTDEGVSGFKGKNLTHGKLGEFVRLVESGVIKPGATLIIENLDRLTRTNIVDAQTLFLRLVSAGIAIVTLTDRQHYSRESIEERPERLYVSLGGLIRANEESATKGTRIRAARAKRREEAKTGFPVKAWTPPWCDFQNGQFVVNQAKAALVRRLFDLYLGGQGSFSIAKLLNAEKIAPLGRSSKGRKASEWYKKIIYDILRDKRVYGFAHQLEKEDYYPPILPRETFLRAQHVNGERRKKKGPTGKTVGNLFTGLAYCSSCAGPMSKTPKHRGKRRYEYLVCENSRAGKTCLYRSIPYPAFEGAFFGAIASNEFFGTLIDANNGAAERIEAKQGELAEYRRQLEAINVALADYTVFPKLLVDKINDLEAKVKKSSAELLALEGARVPVSDDENLGEILGLTNEWQDLIPTKEFRLKVRESLRRQIQSLTIDTLSNPWSCVIRFKSSKAVGFRFWRVEDASGVSVDLDIFNPDDGKKVGKTRCWPFSPDWKDAW